MTTKTKQICILVAVGLLGLVLGVIMAKGCSKKENVPQNVQVADVNSYQCFATTKKGMRCSRRAKDGAFCWQHRKDSQTTSVSTAQSSSSNALTSSQCMATTKKGMRCSRSVKSGRYCWQHQQMYQSETDVTPNVTVIPQVKEQCEAITKKGTRCKRNASSGERYCWQHASMESSSLNVSPSPIANGEFLFVAENADNLTLGVPGPADYIINRAGYAVGYDVENKQPRWVTYCLTNEEANATTVSREGCTFRADALLPSGAATLDDYRHSGYDRGHLACGGDMRWSQTYMDDSFFLSNVSPMNSSFNRGIWAILEKQMRNCAVEKEAIHIVTGPIFTVDAELPTIGANQVTIPSAFYKVVYSQKPKACAVGFILPHEPLKESLPYEFACTVDMVEAQTGLDFFSELPDDVEDCVESEYELFDWFTDF